MMRETFFFTYGSEGHPFYGGWTIVGAESREQAVALFRLVHPDRIEGIINCADIYTVDQFLTTNMYKEGNFGHRCYEVITLEVHPGLGGKAI